MTEKGKAHITWNEAQINKVMPNKIKPVET